VTLLDIYQKALARPPRAPFLRAKQGGGYQDVTAGDFSRQGEALAASLAALGVRQGDRVAILSENRPEWLLSDYALVRLRAVSVPLHATLPVAQVQAILRDAGTHLILVSTASQREKVGRPSWLTRPPAVIVFEPAAARPGDRVLADLLTRTESHPRAGEEPKADDLATLIYTSGTTGEPKGVMLTHGNLAANLVALQALAPLGPADVALSFLPLSHVLERIAGTYLVLLCGGIVAFAEGFDALVHNIREVRPTLMVGVPLFYERLRAKILGEAEGRPAPLQRLFKWGLAVGQAAFAAKQAGQTPALPLRLKAAVADRLVGSRVRAALGGRLRLFVSGGAPLPVEVGAFFHALGLPVYEGYGLTETSPVVSLNRPGAVRLGTVGPPLPGVEVKVAEDGEILVRGANVMAGYWRKSRASRAALKDGWLHTGDLGHLDEAGFLVITDRKKDLLVTGAGKKIAPRGLEERIRRHPAIRDVVIVGEGRAYLAALVVPREEVLRARAAEAGIGGDGADILKDSRTELLLLGDLDRLTADCAPHEKVRRILFLQEPFSLAAGEMTPTLKIRRAVVAARHREEIERLYQADAPARAAWITLGGRFFSRFFWLPRWARRSA
jgi:long-chain acyl-CoA synthetase